MIRTDLRSRVRPWCLRRGQAECLEYGHIELLTVAMVGGLEWNRWRQSQTGDQTEVPRLWYGGGCAGQREVGSKRRIRWAPWPRAVRPW